MTYREQAPEGVQEATRRRIEEISERLSVLEPAIGSLASRVPDGTSAPPEALALLEERERLVRELAELADALLRHGSAGADGSRSRRDGVLARVRAFLRRPPRPR